MNLYQGDWTKEHTNVLKVTFIESSAWLSFGTFIEDYFSYVWNLYIHANSAFILHERLYFLHIFGCL